MQREYDEIHAVDLTPLAACRTESGAGLAGEEEPFWMDGSLHCGNQSDEAAGTQWQRDGIRQKRRGRRHRERAGDRHADSGE